MNKTKSLFNSLYIAGIAINTGLFLTNLFVLNDIYSGMFNVACGVLCWVGYYRTIDNGNK